MLDLRIQKLFLCKYLRRQCLSSSFWRNEVVSELERMLQEIERLQDCRSVLEKAIRDIEGPLHIAEECLYHREGFTILNDFWHSLV